MYYLDPEHLKRCVEHINARLALPEKVTELFRCTCVSLCNGEWFFKFGVVSDDKSYSLVLLRAWADIARALVEHYCDIAIYSKEESARGSGIWPVLNTSYYSSFPGRRNSWSFEAGFILGVMREGGDADFRTDHTLSESIKERLDVSFRQHLRQTAVTARQWILDPMAFLSSKV